MKKEEAFIPCMVGSDGPKALIEKKQETLRLLLVLLTSTFSHMKFENCDFMQSEKNLSSFKYNFGNFSL